MWPFSLIVNSACLVAQWDQREIPTPATEGISQLSAHRMCRLHSKNHFNFFCTDVVWTLPAPRVCECRSDVSGLWHCWEGGDPQTHTKLISVCGNPQLSSLPCPLCARSRLQLPNLILSLLWGLSDQFLILVGFFFSLFWKEWCFFKAGVGADEGKGSGHDKDKPRPF